MINNSNYWENRWQTNQISWHESQIHPLLIANLSHLNLKKGDTVFVPLCGASIDMLYLMQQGYKVVGNELSHIACKRFFHDHQLAYQIEENGFFVVYKSENIHLYCIFSLSENIFTLE